MVPGLSEVPWKLVAWVGLVAVVAFMGWRVAAWHQAYEELKVVEEALAAERECREGSKCAERVKQEEERAAEAEREVVLRYEEELVDLRNRVPAVKYIRVCNKGSVPNAGATGGNDGAAPGTGKPAQETGRSVATDELYGIVMDAEEALSRCRGLQDWNRAMARK